MNMLNGVVVVALAAALSGVAQAATLYTPPLVPQGGRDLNCNVVNVSATAKTLRIQLLNLSGGIVKDSNDIVLAPGEVGFDFADGSEGPLYCKFTVNGAKTTVRTSSCVFEAGVGCIAVVQGE